MHKKRGIAATAIVIIIILVMVFVASDYHYYKNSQILINALKDMRSSPENGFELCGGLTIEEYSQDCYAAYLSVEIENIRADYPNYDDLEGDEKQQATVEIINRISDKVDKVCNLDVMINTDECKLVRATIEFQKESVISS